MAEKPNIKSDELRRTLKDDPDEENLAALVTRIAPAVCKAVFGADGSDACMVDKTENILHWIVHIGQDCFLLLDGDTTEKFLSKADFDWWMAVHEIYFRAFLVFDDEWFREFIQKSGRAGNTIAEDVSGKVPHIGFTLDSLSLKNPKPSARRSVVESLMESFYETARLYLQTLDFLASAEGEDEAVLSDCFISLCTLSLKMSGYAIRLQWPC